MFHDFKNFKYNNNIIIIIIIILMMMMMMTVMMIMITIITETLKDFPYVWYEEYLHNSSFYNKDRIQCTLLCFCFHRTVLLSSFSPVYVSILYEKTKARSLENITSSELGKTYKLIRSVVLFYQISVNYYFFGQFSVNY